MSFYPSRRLGVISAGCIVSSLGALGFVAANGLEVELVTIAV